MAEEPTHSGNQNGDRTEQQQPMEGGSGCHRKMDGAGPGGQSPDERAGDGGGGCGICPQALFGHSGGMLSMSVKVVNDAMATFRSIGGYTLSGDVSGHSIRPGLWPGQPGQRPGRMEEARAGIKHSRMRLKYDGRNETDVCQIRQRFRTVRC